MYISIIILIIFLIKFQENVLDRKVNWNSVYKNLAKTIQEPKIRIFCYKLYHRCAPTNKFLFQKIKEVTSPLCSFCNVEEETTEHLFFFCVKSKEMWTVINNLILKLDDTCDEAKHLNITNSLIGLENPKNITYNFITSYFKFFIWKCKCNKSLPTTSSVRNYFKQIFSLQLYAKKMFPASTKKMLIGQNVSKSWIILRLFASICLKAASEILFHPFTKACVRTALCSMTIWLSDFHLRFALSSRAGPRMAS